MQTKITVTPSEAIELLTIFLKANLVPMITGKPGIGKSDIVRSVARMFKLKLIDLRLSQCDPTDLAGFPSIVGNKADYVPMAHFPLEDDPIPEGYEGWLIFLDEVTSAPPAIQAAAYKLTLDRMVGTHKLHPRVRIACAGNSEADNAVAYAMSTALQSRLAHMELTVSQKDFIKWAIKNKVRQSIIDFLEFKPSMLYTFRPDHSDKTYACPRTWEFVHRVLQQIEPNHPLALPTLSGLISEGPAHEFLTFTEIYNKIPKISEILANPQSAKVPVDEPSMLYAIAGSIASNATKDNLNDLMVYIMRMPREFQVITLRQMKDYHPTISQHPAFAQWAIKNANELF